MLRPTGGSSSWSWGQWAGCWAMEPPFWLAGGALGTLDRVGVAGGGMPAGGFAALVGGDAAHRTRSPGAVKPLLLAVKLALLAGLHALDRAAGLPPCLLTFGVGSARRHAEGPVGVVDLESLAVVLDLASCLPPGPPATNRLGDRAERGGQVGGLLQLGEGHPLAGPQRQLPGDVAVVAAEVVVVLQPCLALLLRRPGLHFRLGGPLGLPGRQRPRRGVLLLVALVAATEQAASAGARMLGFDRGELLLCLVAPLGGALQQPGAVGRRLIQLGLEPVAFG